MNLTTELKKIKTKDLGLLTQEDLVLQANNLLLEAHTEDQEVFRKLGLSTNSYTSKLKEDYQRTEFAKKTYEKESFTGLQVKELCIKYDLRILSIDKYNGKIPSDLGKIVSKFSKDHNIDLNPNNFYILAPVEMFSTEKYVAPDQDPILFYKDSKTTESWKRVEEEDTLIQIHNWGNDFTFLRRFNFMFSEYNDSGRETDNNFNTISIILLTIIGVLFSIFTASMIPIILSNLISIWPLAYNKNYTEKLWNTNLV